MRIEPQKEHQWLQKLMGEWTYESECSMEPGKPPDKSKEKKLTRHRDALNAERRQLPMVEKAYVFKGPAGRVRLLDLFEGRRQLIVYHFMFDPSWDEGCPMCSFLVDNIGHLAHLHARDTSLALVSRAPLAKIEPFKKRMGWTVPWYSSEA